MRKLLLAQLLLCLLAFPLLAQDRLLSGKITAAEDNATLPGVSVIVKGTNQGTTSGADGSYQLRVTPGAVLQVSFIGFATQSVKVDAQTTIDFALKADASNLQEVVVTAQGIRKSQREIGYAISKVETEDVTVGRSPQLAQALSGKVTGLAVYNVNNSVDPAVKIVLRGYRSLTGNNEALVVLDGMQTTSTVLSTINPNDIESVSILKGGQAATLYGSAGINGALIITTKRGVKGKLKIAYSHTTNFENISFLPQVQDKYGAGSAYTPGFGSAGYLPNYLDRMKANWRSFENQQYGDAFDGSIRPQGRGLEDGSQYSLPYSAIPDARRKAFDTGVSMNNQINFQGGDETGTFYMSFENQKINGIVPGDKSDRTGARLSATKEYGKVTASFNVAYNQAAYSRTSSDFYNDVIQQAASVPLSDLRDWRTNKFANPNAYFNDYINNPYFNVDNQRLNYKDANLNGNLNLNLRATPWLTFTERIGILNNSRTGKNTTGKFLYTDWAKSKAVVPAPFGTDDDGVGIYRAITDILGSVQDYSGTENVVNNEFLAQLSKDFGKFSNKLILGSSVYQRTTKAISVGSNSIVVPEVYNVNNRQGELVGGEISTQERRFGYYADLTTNYKNWLILNGSFRFDNTSRFYKPGRPANTYSYPYYGVALSFIATDAFPRIQSQFLNYAKIRVNANKNANDNIPLYGLDLAYNNGTGFPYGNTVGLTVGNTLPDPNLRPETVISYEVGGEFQLLNNRINVDVSAYTQSSSGQVITVRIPNTTGFSNLLINVGETQNWGYEAELKYLIARGSKFSWDASVRYSYNDNKVVDLYPGINEFIIGSVPTGGHANTSVIKDNRFPILKTNGYQYAADGSGQILVNATTGNPLLNTSLVARGGVLPRHIMGLGSKMTYGNFGFTFNFEYRGGNVMFSDLGRQMTFSGTGKWTEDRAPRVLPNSAYLGPDGKTIIPNTTVNIRGPEYDYWVNQYRLISENFVTPAWFIKLRDINLSYNVPKTLLDKTKIFSGANVALFGRNLFTIVDKLNYYTDPEFSYQGNQTPGNTATPTQNTSVGIGINTTGQTPPVRQYGVNLNLTF
jgi:TonB-linked SusC/RagA family outer membrane protein